MYKIIPVREDGMKVIPAMAGVTGQATVVVRCECTAMVRDNSTINGDPKLKIVASQAVC